MHKLSHLLKTFPFFCSILLIPICCYAEGPDQRPPISVVSVGSPTIVYDTARDECSPWDYPDESARAFRDGSGHIHLFINTSGNREMIGTSFSNLRHSCDIALKGGLNTNPAAYDDNRWLGPFWADGNNVFALIHNEFHGSERPDYCPSTKGPNCIEVAVTAAISTDGGYHFQRIPGDQGLVAALPYKFDPIPNSFYGYVANSNIIKHGDYYYVMTGQIDPHNPSHNGVCVMRTQTPGNPSSWRGWDGQGYNQIFVNPYKDPAANPDKNTCAPVTKDFFDLGSLAWSSIRNSFLLVSREQVWEHRKAPGAYLWESKDLIHWTGPTLLLSDAQAGQGVQQYPSLIDPSSSDQNFTTLGNSAILYTEISVPGEKGFSGWKEVARTVQLQQ